MTIRGLGQKIIDLGAIKNIDRRKAQETKDRDPGQGGGDDGKPLLHHELSDEEVQEAIKRLKEVPGVKDANFQFRVVREGKRVVVFVEDPSGKVLRRMSDNELWLTLNEKSKPKGNLLNKAM